MSRLLHFLRNENIGSWNLSIPIDLVGNYDKNSAFLFLWKVNKIHWHLQLISGKLTNKAWRHSTFYLLGGKCSFCVFIPNLCRFSARKQEHRNMPGTPGPVSLCSIIFKVMLVVSQLLASIFCSDPQRYRSYIFSCVSLTHPLPPTPTTISSGWMLPIRISHSTLWKCSSLGVAPHCWVSSEPDSNRASSAGHAGLWPWKLCLQKWVIVWPSVHVKCDRGEESQCTHPWHPNFSPDEILTRGSIFRLYPGNTSTW